MTSTSALVVLLCRCMLAGNSALSVYGLTTVLIQETEGGRHRVPKGDGAYKALVGLKYGICIIGKSLSDAFWNWFDGRIMVGVFEARTPTPRWSSPLVSQKMTSEWGLTGFLACGIGAIETREERELPLEGPGFD
jgi:hypothetical protein